MDILIMRSLSNYQNMKEIEFRAAMLLECLGEPIRFQILQQLHDGSKTVSQLAKLTHRHPSTVCHHVACMRMLHLVRYRNHGRFTFYELKVRGVIEILRLAIQVVPRLAIDGQ